MEFKEAKEGSKVLFIYNNCKDRGKIIKVLPHERAILVKFNEHKQILPLHNCGGEFNEKLYYYFYDNRGSYESINCIHPDEVKPITLKEFYGLKEPKDDKID